MMRFGEWLDAERKKKGWTLEDVAKRISSHKGYICGIIRNKVSPPSARLCYRLARIFQADPIEILVMSRLEKMEPAARQRLLDGYELGRKVIEQAAKTSLTPQQFIDVGKVAIERNRELSEAASKVKVV